MNPPTPRRLAVWLLALSVLLMGAGLPYHACAGSCCGAAAGDASPGAARAPAAHSCCCDAEPVPCDLEQAPAKELPDSAVTGVPRVDAPSPGPILQVGARLPMPAAAGSYHTGRPTSAQGPPGPLYLLHLALLC
ncbi:MAG: hypothetical protein SCH98_09055 [Deferrisomatales bacterium]|nr:hypothetical protein [Deferrisomatales bacterium]